MSFACALRDFGGLFSCLSFWLRTRGLGDRPGQASVACFRDTGYCLVSGELTVGREVCGHGDVVVVVLRGIKWIAPRFGE